MFGDTYITTGPSRVDVHEHKAPTDESIKLTEEFKQKVFDNILHSFNVQNNVFNFQGICLNESWEHSGYQCGYAFELNGEQIKGDFIIHRMMGEDNSVHSIVQKFIKEMAEDIARHIIQMSLKNEHCPIKSMINAERFKGMK